MDSLVTLDFDLLDFVVGVLPVQPGEMAGYCLFQFQLDDMCRRSPTSAAWRDGWTLW